MTSQEWIAYGCVVGACAAVGALFMGNAGVASQAAEAGKHSRGSLPGVFRMVYPLLTALEKMGMGEWLTPPGGAKAKKQQRFIVTGALYPLTPQMVACAQIVYALTLAGLAGLVAAGLGGDAQRTGLAALVAAWMGWLLPPTAVEGAADRRRTELVRGLPFAIDLIGAGMRAGSNFGDSVRFYVTQGGSGALTDEFARLLKQVQIGGVSLPASLEEMAQRVDSKEFTGFVAAVAHSIETGAALVDTLVIQGEEMRRVRFNIAEQKAARAPSLMILPIAVFIMPAVFIIVFTPVYLKVAASGMSGMFGK